MNAETLHRVPAGRETTSAQVACGLLATPSLARRPGASAAASGADDRLATFWAAVDNRRGRRVCPAIRNSPAALRTSQREPSNRRGTFAFGVTERARSARQRSPAERPGFFSSPLSSRRIENSVGRGGSARLTAPLCPRSHAAAREVPGCCRLARSAAARCCRGA